MYLPKQNQISLRSISALPRAPTESTIFCNLLAMPTIKEIIERKVDTDRLDVLLGGEDLSANALASLLMVVDEDRQETIRLVLEGVRDWVSENEYCSKCCSPKKHCPEWGKNASAIDTKDFLALLTQELKDLDK